MTITVFGASGKVGQLVVAEALRRGHKVVAFTHSQSSLLKNKNLAVQQGDVHNQRQVAAAIKNSQAVISALGSWGTSSKDILAAAMKNIIPAMETNNLKRIVSLTGSDARASGDELSLIHKLSHVLFKLIAGGVLNDAEQHIKLLENSSLEWTVVRSPRMKRGGQEYRISIKRSWPWASVSRRAVAICLVDLVEKDNFTEQAVYIS